MLWLGERFQVGVPLATDACQCYGDYGVPCRLNLCYLFISFLILPYNLELYVDYSRELYTIICKYNL